MQKKKLMKTKPEKGGKMLPSHRWTNAMDGRTSGRTDTKLISLYHSVYIHGYNVYLESQ